MSTRTEHYPGALDRRRFLSSVGKGLGLAALSSSTVASLLKDVKAAARRVAHLSAEDAASAAWTGVVGVVMAKPFVSGASNQER